MSIFALSCFIIGILAGFTGFFVYLKGKKEKLNKSWFFFNLSILVWLLGLGTTMVAEDASSALFGQKVLYIGTIFIPVLFFHFCIVFTKKEKQFRKSFKINLFIALLFLFTLFTNNWFIGNIKPRTDFGYWPVEIGWLYYPFLLWFAYLVIYSLWMLKKFLQKKEIEAIKRRQTLIIFYESLIGFSAGSLNFLLDFNIIFPPFHNFFVGSYLIFTAFAIARYHLFGIRLILTETLVGLMGILLFVNLVISQGTPEYLRQGIVFLLFLAFAYYLIKATHEEEKRREEAERLAIQERALRKKSEKLAKEFERLDRAKTQFILATQHHLRTPLSIMKGYISMLLEGSYGRVEEKAKKALTGIQESTEKLIKLVNEFLDISQLQVGREILKKEEIQIKEIIKEIIEELKPVAEKKGIYLKFEKSEELPKIKVDRTKIKTAIFNVIDNGIKYTQKGGVTIKCQIKNDKYQIVVKDTGIGLTEEEMKTIFIEFFERGKEAEKIYTTGRGIGLYIAKNIIEAHQGKIWVESPGKDKGSTFYIELPIK